MPPSRGRRLKLLLLGGTGEALDLAGALAREDGLDVTTSLAGRTRHPVLPAGGVRIGGFGGPEGLADHLRREAIQLLVDATHPFAARMRGNALQAAAAAGVPLLRLERPAWEPEPGDRWLGAADAAMAARLAGAHGARIFLAVGRQELAPFLALPDARLFIRMIESPEAMVLPESAELIHARGPFDEAAEARLFIEKRIDLVVAKNSGGGAYAKIAAARALRLPVVMIARPVLAGGGESVPDVAAALVWIRRWAAARWG